MKSTLADEVCGRCTPHTRFFSCNSIHEFVQSHCMAQGCVVSACGPWSYHPCLCISLPGCRSSSLSHSSISLTTSLTPAFHLTLQDLEIPAPITRNEVYGSVAISTPLVGYESNDTDNFSDMEANAPFFHDSSVYNLGDNGTESPDAGIDDEHIRKALTSSLTIQEQEAEANLRQAYHSYDESSFPGAPSILARTERPVAWRRRVFTKTNIQPRVG